MRLRYTPEARDQLRAVPPGPKRALRVFLEDLAREWPAIDGKTVKPLSDRPWTYFRARSGSYRAAFQANDEDIVVFRVFHRRDGYSWMERLG